MGKNFKEDEEIEDLFLDFYSQGSYSTNTGIKPKNDDEFDVDAILLLELDEENEPQDILKWIASRIKSHKEFEKSVKTKDRCVRIDYAGDFHVDIVPALPCEGVIKIPSKKENEWCKTNPKGFTSCQCRRCGFDPWVGKTPGEGNGNPRQCSCLGNPMDRGAWWNAVHGVTKIWTRPND